MKKQHLLLIATAMLLGGVSQGVLAGKFFVYQLPDGSRVISDRPIDDSTHRLVTSRTSAEGTGKLAASRYRKRPSALKQLETLISQVSHRHSMDVALVKAVIHTESYFNVKATSRVGASGLMQLMPQTAKIYGVRDIYDPVENLEAGVKHLRYLMNKYNNNLRHALAAYNAGEEAVFKYDGIPPYEETQNYVQKVLFFHDFYQRVN